ncbi:DUF6543 domain-containing protein [Pseudomonas sp.]|uniref:DUF6543 domain-containing protein n=1 Tax=Pseudomonas sp. TaxID=306 RepID=UPI0028AAE554|nr:DUF6543 domain-containing protein [Pseudomonas sp.]
MHPSRLSSVVPARQHVAACFAGRPTLRQTVAKEGFSVLQARCPWISHHFPRVQSLEHIWLMPADQTPAVALVDTLLEHWLTHQPLRLAADSQLSMAPPEPLRAPEHPAGEHAFADNVMPMEQLSADFNGFLEALVEVFQRAQVSYWTGSEPGSDISRLHWVAQLLKGILLANIEYQGLADDEKELLYALSEGGAQAPRVSALQITLLDQGITHERNLPDLLVHVERGGRQTLLWCNPCATVRSFDSLEAFGTALDGFLSQIYRFDAMTWACQKLEEDPFAYLAMQLLNGVLDSLGRLCREDVTEVSVLETLYSLLSDPSWVFCDSEVAPAVTFHAALPAWLDQASATDRFEYQQVLFELAARQALSKGGASTSDIDSLEQYAARRLSEQMRLDHPDSPALDPDALQVSIAQVVQVSSTGPARLEPLRTESLTALAIARLRGSDNEALTGVTDSDSGSVPAWMNPDYVQQMVYTLDIGGQYPLYVKARLDEAASHPQRLQAFAVEWRTALLLNALRARIERRLSENAWYALSGFCRTRSSEATDIQMAPLAFRCTPQASAANTVHYTFLLRFVALDCWVLYRPLLIDDAIRQYDNLGQLMADIRAEGELQQNMLAWLDDDARDIYADGGFAKPNLHRDLAELAHLLGGAPGILDALLRAQRVPASISFTAWQGDLDNPMFQARGQALTLLASRQSPSNAQLRWSMITQLAWLAFDTLVALLPGPVASVLWLVGSLKAIKQDMAALTDGGQGERVLAGVDLLINLAMLLSHRHGAGEVDTAASSSIEPKLLGVQKRQAETTFACEEPRQVAWKPVEQLPQAPLNVTRWADTQRLGNLSAEQRQRLNGLRAAIDLRGRQPEPHGRLRGLFKVEGRYYVDLQGSAFEVQESWSGLHIIGPEQWRSEWSSQWGGNPDGYYIAGRERSVGPWVTRWNGQWALGLNLAGGMPRTRQAISEANHKAYLALKETTKANNAALVKLDDLARPNTARMIPYEEATQALRQDIERLPEDQAGTLPDELKARRDALTQMRRELHPHIHMLALLREKQAAYLVANIELYTQLCEPRFARFDPIETARYARGQWSEQLLDNDMYLFHRLLESNDYDSIKTSSNTLAKLEWGEEQASLYASYRERLGSALDVHRRLLVVSTRLDENLTAFMGDAQVQFDNKAQKINRYVDQRHYSTLLVRGQIVSDLAHLTLDRDLLTLESFDELLRLQAGLHDSDLQRAILSHDGLATAELPADQQAEILSNVVREYDRSLAVANYMLAVEDPAINAARLTEYSTSLSAIKALAERDLSHRLKEQASGVAAPLRALPYRPKPGKPKLIRTARGKAVLAQQGSNEDHAVQRDPITRQSVARFELRGDRWYEVSAPAAEKSATALRNIGTGLLARKEQQLALAARYTSEPNSLADLLDWHINDMTEIASQLEAGPDDGHALAGRLRLAAEEMEREKNRLLTAAYIDTRHPDSTALRYLLARGEVDITLAKSRKRLGDGDFLDVYAIDRISPRRKLWEAHFHYTDAGAAPQAFAKGHLKFWEPRSLNRDEQLQRSTTPAERIRIYRGDLSHKEAAELIPFLDS